MNAAASRQVFSLLTTAAAVLPLAFTLAASSIASDNANYQTNGGLSVYLGLLPAAMVERHPQGHAEATMHGGPPTDEHAYHIVVAIFDGTSGERVGNATVTAVLSGVGHVGATNVELEPMLIDDTITYGGYVDLGALERFDIAVAIEVPGRGDPVRIVFANEHVP